MPNHGAYSRRTCSHQECTSRAESHSPHEVVTIVLKAEKSNGAKLILWTCRRDERLATAVEYCKTIGLTFDAINENLPEMIDYFGGDTRKIYADVYIDDKALRMPCGGITDRY